MNRFAKVWALRDPNGRQFRFKNLYHFVRRHSELFAPSDLKPSARRQGSLRVTNLAIRGLSSISPRNIRPRLSWKGWTWISIHERRFNHGKDLLARNPQ
jgi:hypothetical protein